MARGRICAVLTLLCGALAGCGAAASDAPVGRAATTATAGCAQDGCERGRTRGERLLSRAPYLGVACPEANSIACDRVGLAVWLKRAATHVTATINGRGLRLRAGRPDGRGAWYRGYLQPAGMLDGPLKVTPDRGRYHWEGAHPLDARVRIQIRRRSGRIDAASLAVPLHAGWG